MALSYHFLPNMLLLLAKRGFWRWREIEENLPW